MILKFGELAVGASSELAYLIFRFELFWFLAEKGPTRKFEIYGLDFLTSW